MAKSNQGWRAMWRVVLDRPDIPITIRKRIRLADTQHSTDRVTHRLGSDPGEWLRKVLPASYPVIRCGFVPGSETEQGLKCSHGLTPTIVAKDEFVEVSLELIAAHTVVGSDQPLLQVANRAVCQRHHGLRTFTQVDSPRLVARQVLEPSFLQSGEAFEAIGVYR